MAKTSVLAFSVTLALAAVPAVAAGPAVYGSAVTVEKPTPIAALLDAPAEHAGRVVRVEGKISGVCAMAGCWMELEDEARRRVRIKVEDGVIVFPADAVGQKAVAQGTVRLETLSRERYVAWRKHLAEETGAPFDEAAVGAGPFQVVEIAGSGASIGD